MADINLGVFNPSVSVVYDDPPLVTTDSGHVENTLFRYWTNPLALTVCVGARARGCKRDFRVKGTDGRKRKVYCTYYISYERVFIGMTVFALEYMAGDENIYIHGVSDK